MSFLKSKSETNLKSADLLITKNFYSSSVHCSYYSCVQLMLHILRSDLKKTESEIEIESKQGSIEELGFHNWLRNFISREFFSRKKAEEGIEFNTFFGNLAGLRVKADYKNYDVKAGVANDSYSHAKSIISLLISNFSV